MGIYLLINNILPISIEILNLLQGKKSSKFKETLKSSSEVFHQTGSSYFQAEAVISAGI